MADEALQAQLDAKLHELVTAEEAVVNSYSGGVVLWNAGGADIAAYITQAQDAIDTLQGPLYDAVLGNHNFPLDTGTGVNQAAAIDAWNRLASSTQQLLSGTLHYETAWGPMPFLSKVGNDLTSPTKWPWWLQLFAGVGLVYYGSKIFGSVGEAKQAWSGYTAAKRKRRR